MPVTKVNGSECWGSGLARGSCRPSARGLSGLNGILWHMDAQQLWEPIDAARGQVPDPGNINVSGLAGAIQSTLRGCLAR
jgi:hypothetical protein